MTREEFANKLGQLLVESAESEISLQEIYAETALFMKQVEFIFNIELAAAYEKRDQE